MDVPRANVGQMQEAEKNLMAGAAGYHKTAVDRLYSKEMFMERFSHILGAETKLSPTDLEVLLIFLSRDQEKILYDGKVYIVLLFTSC